MDVVVNHIVVEAAPAALSFRATYNGVETDTYDLWEAGQPEPGGLAGIRVEQ